MEMTVKQITSKINSTEKKIDELTRYSENYKKWIAEAENKNDSLVSVYKRSLRDIEKKLNKYEAQLAEFKGMIEGKVKEYPVVREFVKTWKTRCIEHITDPKTINNAISAYQQMEENQKKIEEEFKAKGRPSWEAYNTEKLVEKDFNREWGFVWVYLKSDKTIDMERLEKDYEYEATRKYNKFIEDCEYYVGKITDTSELSVGRKGDLNGFVVGTKGKVEVDTISACGEVQRFHYRTLFKMVK